MLSVNIKHPCILFITYKTTSIYSRSDLKYRPIQIIYFSTVRSNRNSPNFRFSIISESTVFNPLSICFSDLIV